jgi:Putative antitoxin
MISHGRIVNPGKNGSCPKLFPIDEITQSMHGLCMATKTISIEIDAYELLKREKRSDRESFSQVVRRLTSERPALTAAELEEAMKPFIGKGAGKKR